MILNESQRQILLNNVYLSGSHIVRLPNDLYKNIMLITASCGRGKSTYALSLNGSGLLAEINAKRQQNNLCRRCRDIQPEEVLVLSSRVGITAQQLKNSNVVKAASQDFTGTMDFIDSKARQGKIRATTAQAFGEMIRRDEVKIIPKVIVIDEIHSIFAEYFAESLIYVIKFLEKYYNDIIKIGLTATPDFLFNYVKDFSFQQIDIDIGSKYKVKNVRVVMNGKANSQLEEYIKGISSDRKLIYYTQSATQCYLLSQQYQNSAYLISDYNETVIKDKATGKEIDLAQQMKEAGVKQYILENERLPDNINILFINSACREGINIKDKKVKCIICEAVDMITIQQILGRIRNDLEEYIIMANFNYKQINENTIKEYCNLVEEAENSINPQGLLGQRYQKQKDNKHISPFVYQYNEFFYINNYAKYYLQYIQETYLQLSNYENNRKGNIVQVGDRELTDYESYFKQLERFAERRQVEILQAQQEKIIQNHINGIVRFVEIEQEWLGKPIDKQEKVELCEALSIVRNQGKIAGWNTVKGLLLDAGYTITDTTKSHNGKRCRVSIISR